MRLSDVTGFGALLSAGVLFASCGAPQQVAVPPPGTVQPARAPASSAVRPAGHGISWMARGVQQRDLLYVSNGNGEVNIYRYWQHTLVGVLANFKQPLGECADWAGNVYIVDHQTQRVREYAHGGTAPLKSLNDSPNAPYACSVDPKTGDVAVANNPEDPALNGNVAIFIHGQSDRVVAYYGKHRDQFTSDGYDSRGDLFATSTGGNDGQTYFYYLPRYGTRLLAMHLKAPGQSSSGWGHVQGAAWDGKYWVVESDDVLYRFIIKLAARYVSDAQLEGADAGPIAIYRRAPRAAGTEVVAGSGGVNGTIDYWDYPYGGNPIAHITKDLDAPFGVAISLRTR